MTEIFLYVLEKLSSTVDRLATSEFTSWNDCVFCTVGVSGEIAFCKHPGDFCFVWWRQLQFHCCQCCYWAGGLSWIWNILFLSLSLSLSLLISLLSLSLSLYLSLSLSLSLSPLSLSLSCLSSPISLSLSLSLYCSINRSVLLCHPIVISIVLSFVLSIHLFFILSIYLSIYPSIYLSVRPSIHPSIHPSILCQSVHLSVLQQ